MDYILRNAVPILAASAAGLLVSIAYHFLPGAKAGGMAGRTDPPLLLATAALMQLWLCCILAGALILAPTDQGAGPWTMALGSAVVIWIGFIAPVIATSYAYRGVGRDLAFKDALAWLLVMLTQAAVLRWIGMGV
ncbi:MAG: hypothetical protein K2P95_01995 [Hyphomonadaceae bacterium]|nr:hypothetical protein [Hyphomonadaceae bacterium]